jgi:DNA-binding PadR family transcriptional regulator
MSLHLVENSRMSLSHAILVCLADEPMTGYELAKRFDSSVGFFWRANHQQIYRELGQLDKKGWARGETIAQATRPNKIIFQITPTGEAELLAWSRIGSAPATLKEELMLKFYALDKVDLPALLTQIDQRKKMHQTRLALYERILARRFASVGDLSLVAKGKLAGLKAGMRFEKTWIEWCEDVQQMLGSPLNSAIALVKS